MKEPIGSNSRVVAHDGRVLTLGRLVKSGGAGSIHSVAETPDLVAKIYHPNVDAVAYERKLEAMLALPPDVPGILTGDAHEVQLAWPRLLLRDGQQRFLGFAMPLVDFEASVELEWVIQERQAKAAGLPTGLSARLALAANLASLTAALHQRGHYVVDLKPVNLRMYRRSLRIAMLDCDGFSIQGHVERFNAPQFTPDYLAPEFHGQRSLAFDEEIQDRFALAVVVFQLLNFGIHPFTGRPSSESVPTDIPGRIANRCYAYGIRPNPRMAPNLASGHRAIPTELRAMFDRSFDNPGVMRPSAALWADALRDYANPSTKRLVTCSIVPRHQHFAEMPCGTCARDARIKQAVQAASTAKPRRGLPQPRRPQTLPQLGVGSLKKPTQTQSLWSLRKSAPAAFGFIVGLSCLSLVPCGFAVAGFVSLLSARNRPPPEAVRESTIAERASAANALFDQVLSAADGPDKDAVLELLRQRPIDQTQCQLAIDLWETKSRWTAEEPRFNHLRFTSVEEYYRRHPCKELNFRRPEIMRAQYSCRVALRAPERLSSAIQAGCKDIVAGGNEVMRRAVLFGPDNSLFAWRDLAHGYLMADDDTNAFRSLVVSSLLNHGNSTPSILDALSTTVFSDLCWLSARAQILEAKAITKVSQWYGEVPSAEITAQATTPWPDEPPLEERELPGRAQKKPRVSVKPKVR